MRAGLGITALRVTGLKGPKGSRNLPPWRVSSLRMEWHLPRLWTAEHSEATSLQSQVQQTPRGRVSLFGQGQQKPGAITRHTQSDWNTWKTGLTGSTGGWALTDNEHRAH